MQNADAMQDKAGIIERILTYLYNTRGYDFRGGVPAMIERRIERRRIKSGQPDLTTYAKFLEESKEETDLLIDGLTINVSRFFRDSFTFEYLDHQLLPGMIREKFSETSKELRIWSAGCAGGEEPYSVAMLIDQQLKRMNQELGISIYATDLNRRILEYAKSGIYPEEALVETKMEYVQTYFNRLDTSYSITPEVKGMVRFHYHDLLDSKSYVPRESIYGNFDMVLCRNVLIYFTFEYQKKIIERLYRSLKPGGLLVLGDAESIMHSFEGNLDRETALGKIYRKEIIN